MKIQNALIFLIIFAISLSLISCSTTYEPVESTEEEQKTVCTVSVGGETYHVRYELYRALFLTYKSEIDGENPELWEGEGAEALVEEINEKILARISDIYSVIHACALIGFDLYSREVEGTIEEFIKYSVEGGVYNGDTIEGYGSYEKYLAALKELGLNYSVQTLMFRYSIGLDALERYYIGTDDGVLSEDTPGEFTYTEESLRDFYFSEACVRVLRTYIQEAAVYDPEERIEKIRKAVMEAAPDGDVAVATAMIANGSLIAESEVFAGYVIAKHNLDLAYFGEMVDVTFALDEGEVSKAISIHDGRERAYYVLYRAEKSEEHFKDNYGSIAYVYLKDRLGELLEGYAVGLASSVKYTKAYSEIKHSEITME